MAARLKEYGPFHRFQSAEDNELVSSTGLLGGRPDRNIAQGLFPKVKAIEGPLPEGRRGIEFFTRIAPDRNHVPRFPVWSGPRDGVIDSKTEPDLVLIKVRITRRSDR